MQRFGLSLSIFALAVFGLGFYGCSKSETSTPATSTSTDGDQDHDDDGHGDHNHGDHNDHDHGDNKDQAGMTDMEKMTEGLANLSEEDRASAMKQHTCPVTGEMLGTMGEPIKLTVKEREVWVCCKGCKKDMTEDPDKYLAKLDK